MSVILCGAYPRWSIAMVTSNKDTGPNASICSPHFFLSSNVLDTNSISRTGVLTEEQEATLLSVFSGMPNLARAQNAGPPTNENIVPSTQIFFKDAGENPVDNTISLETMWNNCRKATLFREDGG
jgi:hypothetical protein